MTLSSQAEDAFSLLDVALTELIVPGMTKAQAIVVLYALLDLREIRDRLEKTLT